MDPAPTPITDVPTITTCAEGTLYFSFSITTDSFAEETSWVLENPEGEYLRGNNLTNDRTYNTEKCIPLECYTLFIYDTFGDGLCCSGNVCTTPAGYMLTVDGSVITSTYADPNFVQSVSILEVAQTAASRNIIETTRMMFIPLPLPS